jgi:aspartyl-tRNA(Asn)/glutamyl-tRNA(Gln) amidotransferase subunit A
MTKLTDLTITEALAKLDKKEISAVELTKEHIAAAEKGQEQTNAFILTMFESALEEAKKSDARRASGKVGAMEGLPIAMKDLYCTKGFQTTAGSKILKGFVPTYESTVSQKLANAGCITLGKANLDEFAMGSANITSAYGNVISPWSGAEPKKAARKLIPGGSSGGSAAAVAGRFAMAATGTDTAARSASRLPLRASSASSRLTALLALWHRGLCVFAGSGGPMTRSVADAALILREMPGHDPQDSTSVNMPVPDFTKAGGQSIKGLKIGIPREYRIDGLPAETNAFWDKGAQMLREAGAEIIEISLPHTKYALPTYYIIAPAEASSNLARYDGVRFGLRETGESLIDMYENTRGEGFGVEVRRRILMGTYVLSGNDAYYLKAQKVRRCIRNDFFEALKKCDVILTPTATGTAFAIGDKEEDPIQMYLNDVFTVTLNLAGLPGISVPVGLCADGLPLGLQMIGRAFDEETLFKVAAALESAAGFAGKPPFTP